MSTRPIVAPRSTQAILASPMRGEVFPQTRLRLLRASEVDSWSSDKLRYAINEMYVRRGLTFKSPTLCHQFVRFSWYKPRSELHETDAYSRFNYFEKANLRLMSGLRDKRGRLARSSAARHRFMAITGFPNGRPGWIIDHIKPLKEGGADDPSNMQWQTVADAKAKDKWE